MTDRLAAIVEQLSQQNPFSGTEGLADPPRPSEAAIPRDRPSLDQVPHIQQQINVLTYNHLPRTFFSLEKHRSLQSILLTAKEALAEALPIRCLEATFVALHLTQCLRDIDRIPLSFKSEANGNTYRHIVLVLRTRSTPSLYGALGLSRKSSLMYKPMTFRSLYDLVMDYKAGYEALGHELADIKLGIAITHDEHSRWDPCWRFIALKLSRYRVGAADTPDAAALPSAAGRHLGSPGTPAIRHNGSQAGEASTPPLLNLDATPGVVVRSGNSDTPSHVPRRTASLSASASFGSPTAPRAVSTTALEGEDYSPLERFLGNYTRLLPTICEQYYKTLPTVDASNRALRLCYMDLDTAEKDAGAENQRRLQHITEMQSPLGPEARRVAAHRQLRSAKKERAGSRQPAAASNGGGDAAGAKRRLVSSHEGRPAKRRSPASPVLSTSDTRKNASAAQRTRSPRVQLLPTTPARSGGGGGAAAPATPPSMASAASREPVAVASLSLSAALAESASGPRYLLALEGTTVDAHSICSSASAERAATEGYVTPRDMRRGAGAGEADDAAAIAPPRTPRNYDAREPATPYDAFLRTPSSTSDLFSSPTSLNNTTITRLPLSP